MIRNKTRNKTHFLSFHMFIVHVTSGLWICQILNRKDFVEVCHESKGKARATLETVCPHTVLS